MLLRKGNPIIFYYGLSARPILENCSEKTPEIILEFYLSSLNSFKYRFVIVNSRNVLLPPSPKK
jgi:hypothetical protein